jgi:hypothetical protein
MIFNGAVSTRLPTTDLLVLSVLSIGSAQSPAPTRTTEVHLSRIIDAGNR